MIFIAFVVVPLFAVKFWNDPLVAEKLGVKKLVALAFVAVKLVIEPILAKRLVVVLFVVDALIMTALVVVLLFVVNV